MFPLIYPNQSPLLISMALGSGSGSAYPDPVWQTGSYGKWRMSSWLIFQTDYGEPTMANWRMANWCMEKDRIPLESDGLCLKKSVHK